MSYGSAAAESNDKPSIFLNNVDQWSVIEITRISHLYFDKYQGNVRPQPMPLSNLLFLRIEVQPSRAMRNQHGKVQDFQAVPQESRLVAGEIKSLEAKLKAAKNPRNDRPDDCY